MYIATTKCSVFYNIPYKQQERYFYLKTLFLSHKILLTKSQNYGTMYRC
jgi:hypothetical protein